MSTQLSDMLINRCVTIVTIGKELKEAGSHTQQDAARIERIYFEMGSLVLANIGTISSALNLAEAMRTVVNAPVATPEQLESQIKYLNDIDLTKQ